MNVWAYCAADWLQATANTAGVDPITSPPAGAGLSLVDAAAADLVILNLHGFADQPDFYGQARGKIGPSALTVSDVKRHDWQGVVVFAEVCFGLQSNIAQAFVSAGATFIGSDSTAYGRTKATLFDGEADRLAYFFRLFYRPGRDVAQVLRLAKGTLALASIPLDADDRATLRSFKLLRGTRT